jgi:hypothetical protein
MGEKATTKLLSLSMLISRPPYFLTIQRHSPDLADIFAGDIYTVITEGPEAVPVRVAWIHKVGYCLFSYISTALFNWKTKQALEKHLANNYFILSARVKNKISE